MRENDQYTWTLRWQKSELPNKNFKTTIIKIIQWAITNTPGTDEDIGTHGKGTLSKRNNEKFQEWKIAETKKSHKSGSITE